MLSHQFESDNHIGLVVLRDELNESRGELLHFFQLLVNSCLAAYNRLRYEIFEEKSDHSVVVDCMSDLMVMALGILIDKIPDDEPRQEVRPEESSNLVGLRIRNELLDIERMILSEEELNSRELEEKKRENKMIIEKERIRKAKYRQKQKEDLTKLKIEQRNMEEDDWDWEEMDDETRAVNGIKSEPVDDEYPGMNPTERILNLCEPSTSRVTMKEEPVDEEDVMEVEPSNFMTRTRARMERVRRLTNGEREGRGVIVGGTAEIRGVRRVHTLFEQSNTRHYAVAGANDDVSYAYIPPMNPLPKQMRRPGPSLLSSRLKRLERKSSSPSPSPPPPPPPPPPSAPSAPPLTLRSILQAQIPHAVISKSVRKRMKPNQ